MSWFLLIGGKRNVGKSTLAEIIKKKTNALMIDLSQVVRESAKKNGWTNDIAVYAKKKREKEGMDVFAKACLKKIEEKKGDWIVCGIRAREEVLLFKRKFPRALFVFVRAPENARWRKIAESTKPKDVTKQHAEELERWLSTSNLRQYADVVVCNDEGLSKLYREAEKILLLLKHKSGDFLQNKNA
jgi:dephospho-CoA kinase